MVSTFDATDFIIKINLLSSNVHIDKLYSAIDRYTWHSRLTNILKVILNKMLKAFLIVS